MVHLEKADKMRPEHYPSFTLLWQIIAYFQVCAEACRSVPCDVFVDTIGVGAAYPLVSFVFGIRVLSYTHYPTISSDMVDQVDQV